MNQKSFISKRDPELLINDIIKSGNKIIAYTKGMTFKSFSEDDKTADAVIRNFEIIGEADNRLSAEFKNNHHQIDWQQIRGFRNRIVHDYFGIDYEIIWQIKETYLPQLLNSLHKIK